MQSRLFRYKCKVHCSLVSLLWWEIRPYSLLMVSVLARLICQVSTHISANYKFYWIRYLIYCLCHGMWQGQARHLQLCILGFTKHRRCSTQVFNPMVDLLLVSDSFLSGRFMRHLALPPLPTLDGLPSSLCRWFLCADIKIQPSWRVLRNRVMGWSLSAVYNWFKDPDR